MKTGIISEKEYNELKGQYGKPDNKDKAILSYVYRCFWTGDDEEYQFGPNDPSVLATMNKWVPGGSELFQHWYADRRDNLNTACKLLKLLEGHIWNLELSEKDYDLWEDIVCGGNYQEYKEHII